jgi:hypothetical protein
MDIRSGNEIGQLYSTIGKMEADMAEQYRDIRQFSENYQPIRTR